jgi:transcriptional regulator GlxA family with amidase domain
LNRLFKRHTGMSVKEYLVRCKLDRARSLLTQSSMTVTEVALSLDYADVYIFSKLFRKYFGLPPSHYARSTRPTDVAEGDRSDS